MNIRLVKFTAYHIDRDKYYWINPAQVACITNGERPGVTMVYLSGNDEFKCVLAAPDEVVALLNAHIRFIKLPGCQTNMVSYYWVNPAQIACMTNGEQPGVTMIYLSGNDEFKCVRATLEEIIALIDKALAA